VNLKRLALAAGVALVAIFITGFIADLLSFDRTKGGYEPPYSDYTGEPIDWTAVETTPTGMSKSGYVVDVFVDCTSGMMHFALLGIKIPFRKFSPRALVVHKPREACAERGFSPEF
jgi:hypothetical protein